MRRPRPYASEAAFRRGLEDRLKARASELLGPPERGSRFTVDLALAGRPFASFHMDVGVGDPELEPPDWIEGEDFLSFAGIPAARIALVPVAQQVAEKLHAYTRPRPTSPNTRVKDLVDLNLLLEAGLPGEDRLAAALRATFESYASHPLPSRLPEPPVAWVAPYEALARQIGLAAATLESGHAAVAALWAGLVTRI